MWPAQWFFVSFYSDAYFKSDPLHNDTDASQALCTALDSQQDMNLFNYPMWKVSWEMYLWFLVVFHFLCPDCFSSKMSVSQIKKLQFPMKQKQAWSACNYKWPWRVFLFLKSAGDTLVEAVVHCLCFSIFQVWTMCSVMSTQIYAF